MSRTQFTFYAKSECALGLVLVVDVLGDLPCYISTIIIDNDFIPEPSDVATKAPTNARITVRLKKATYKEEVQSVNLLHEIQDTLLLFDQDVGNSGESYRTDAGFITQVRAYRLSGFHTFVAIYILSAHALECSSHGDEVHLTTVNSQAKRFPLLAGLDFAKNTGRIS
jgi:hypothetical protein